MSLTPGYVFYGVVTIDFIYSVTPTTHKSFSGIKADVASVTIDKKESTFEIEDGTEYTNSEGWTGTLEFKLSQLDQTLLTTLETYAPGLTSGVDKVKFTFTELGSGSNFTVSIVGITGLTLGIETGTTWKMNIKYKITGAAGTNLSDLVTIAHA